MIRNNHDAGIKRTVVYWHKLSKMKIYADPGGGGEVLPYNHYLYGYVPPNGVVIMKLLI